MSEQLYLHFPDLPAPAQQEAFTDEAPETLLARRSRLETALGRKAVLSAGDYLEGAKADQITEQLSPFMEYIDAYAPHKREIEALFKQFLFPVLTAESLEAMSSDQREVLSVHFIEYVDRVQGRGRVLATDGAFGGLVAEDYGFADETACTAYGQELIAFANTIREQPLFKKMNTIAAQFLSAWQKKQYNYRRTYEATRATRRRFVAADAAQHGELQVVLKQDNAAPRLHLQRIVPYSGPRLTGSPMQNRRPH